MTEQRRILKRALFHIKSHSMNYAMEPVKPLSRYPLTFEELDGVARIILSIL